MPPATNDPVCPIHAQRPEKPPAAQRHDRLRGSTAGQLTAVATPEGRHPDPSSVWGVTSPQPPESGESAESAATGQRAAKRGPGRPRKTTTRTARAGDARTAPRSPVAEHQPAKSAAAAGLPATLAKAAGGAVQIPVTVARDVVSRTTETPVAVVAAAAAVVGLVEWPVAVTAIAGYAILRRWGPLRTRPTRP
jgi:hypothetical protein